jgi:IS5 family transposase
VDPKHPPVRLAALIERGRPAEAFGPPCREGVGRPGSPTRPMAGPHLLKHLDGLSDEAVRARYPDSPHVRPFCGEAHFRHAPPPERTPMTRWRERIGAERLELPPAETPAAAGRAGAVEEKHPRRATIDATVQPEAVAHPTGGKLLLRGVGILNRSARRNGVALRQPVRRGLGPAWPGLAGAADRPCRGRQPPDGAGLAALGPAAGLAPAAPRQLRRPSCRAPRSALE